MMHFLEVQGMILISLMQRLILEMTLYVRVEVIQAILILCFFKEVQVRVITMFRYKVHHYHWSKMGQVATR